MFTIYKYPLEPLNTESILMPPMSKLLYVGNQDGNLCLWALVDAGVKPTVYRRIVVVGTGHELPKEANHITYVGTAIIDPYVWHVFEIV